MNAISEEQITAEVLELGEMLFDTIIEVAARNSGDEMDADLLEEMQLAANEYFAALRLLLGNKQPVQDMAQGNN